MIETPADTVDVHRFRRMLDQAHATRDPDLRSAQLRAALGLWRGPALVDAGNATLRERLGTGLDELRVEAVSDRIDVDFCLGRHERLVAELKQLVAEHPLRERLHAQLMLALYRSGRRAEALETYRLARATLARELGLDPGPELQRLERDILVDSSDLLVSSRSAPVHTNCIAQAAPSQTLPAQLPADLAAFAGRSEELQRLDAVVALTDPPRSSTAVVAVIGGTAGVGKTTLAVHWSHRMRSRFPDGQLFVNLRGFGLTADLLSPAQAIRGFLDALGVPEQRIPPSLDAQIGLYRSLLSERRMLIVLDNARDAEQVRPLLPGASGCMVLVTSRNRLTGLVSAEGAHPITLSLPSAEEASELLKLRLGVDRVAPEPGAMREILQLSARLPLALALVAARAAMNPEFPLADLAAELRGARGSLDVFGDTDPTTDVRNVLSWSYRALSPAAARLFRLLSQHPGPDISLPSAGSLVGSSVKQVRPALAELVNANLITEMRSARFSLHELLRVYASELAGALDPPEYLRAARRRLLDHYIHTAHAADLLLNPHRDPLALPPLTSGVTPEKFVNRDAALAWFTTERQVTLAAQREAVHDRLDAQVWQLGWVLAQYLTLQGFWHDQIISQTVALEAARATDDLPAQAVSHRLLARAFAMADRNVEAVTHYVCALEQHGRLGDRIGEATARMGLGRVCTRQEDWKAALGHAERARELYVAAGHADGEAMALNAIGWCNAMLGDYDKARAFCEKALVLLRRVNDPLAEAGVLDSLGYAHRQLRQYEQAAACYELAVGLYRKAGDRYNEADVLTHLGDAQIQADRRDAARIAWQKAIAILDELGHPDAAQVRARLESEAFDGASDSGQS